MEQGWRRKAGTTPVSYHFRSHPVASPKFFREMGMKDTLCYFFFVDGQTLSLFFFSSISLSIYLSPFLSISLFIVHIIYFFYHVGLTGKLPKALIYMLTIKIFHSNGSFFLSRTFITQLYTLKRLCSFHPNYNKKISLKSITVYFC